MILFMNIILLDSDPTYLLYSLEGVSCENEAEFRSYEILLNLNEGDTLREAQTLDEVVRKQPRSFFSLSLFLS